MGIAFAAGLVLLITGYETDYFPLVWLGLMLALFWPLLWLERSRQRIGNDLRWERYWRYRLRKRLQRAPREQAGELAVASTKPTKQASWLGRAIITGMRQLLALLIYAQLLLALALWLFSLGHVPLLSAPVRGFVHGLNSLPYVALPVLQADADVLISQVIESSSGIWDIDWLQIPVQSAVGYALLSALLYVLGNVLVHSRLLRPGLRYPQQLASAAIVAAVVVLLSVFTSPLRLTGQVLGLLLLTWLFSAYVLALADGLQLFYVSDGAPSPKPASSGQVSPEQAAASADATEQTAKAPAESAEATDGRGEKI